jgi:thioredoxin reductase (NADPH)
MPNVTLYTHTEVIDLKGGEHFEGVVLRNHRTGKLIERPYRHLLMTGANPNTEWLRGCLALDDKGFVITAPDSTDEHLKTTGWSLPKKPRVWETSIPGTLGDGAVSL